LARRRPMRRPGADAAVPRAAAARPVPGGLRFDRRAARSARRALARPGGDEAQPRAPPRGRERRSRRDDAQFLGDAALRLSRSRPRRLVGPRVERRAGKRTRPVDAQLGGGVPQGRARAATAATTTARRWLRCSSERLRLRLQSAASAINSGSSACCSRHICA
jgi:hypothetical protein